MKSHLSWKPVYYVDDISTYDVYMWTPNNWQGYFKDKIMLN